MVYSLHFPRSLASRRPPKWGEGGRSAIDHGDRSREIYAPGERLWVPWRALTGEAVREFDRAWEKKTVQTVREGEIAWEMERQA